MVKKIFSLLLFIAGICGMAIFAQRVEASTIVVNSIEMNNFMPQNTLRAQDEIYPIENTAAYALEFAPDIRKFQITILEEPYAENRQKAENAFLEKLHVTRNEACFLEVRVVAPAAVQQESVANVSENETLSFCKAPKLADANNDGVVNTFDYAICLDELVTPPVDLKMACDINVNRRIDATDLSQIITYLKKF